MNQTSSSSLAILLFSFLLLGIVNAYPPSFGDFLRYRLYENLADQLIAQPQTRRYDAAWRHIGLGKRKRSLLNRVIRDNGETISLMQNGRHLAVIGLGRK